MASSAPLRVLAMTSSSIDKNPTWQMRVELMLPLLAAHGIEVDTRRVPTDRRAIRELFDSLSGYDIAWLHRKILWPSDIRRLRQAARAIVLDVDDPVNLSSSSFANFKLARCLKFRATAKASAAIFAGCDGLMAEARRFNRNVHFLPMCLDLAAYSRAVQPRRVDEPLRLLWLGGRSTFKYLEQIRPHLERIGARLNNLTLTVVGHQPLTLERLAVESVQWSPEAERLHLRRAHVGLVPVANNRWTRAKSTFKPLQYMASGMPFVGSLVGVNFRYADDGKNGLLADTPDEWLRAVERLQGDETLRQRMGRSGIAYVERNHVPEVFIHTVVQVFRSIAGSGPRRLAA